MEKIKRFLKDYFKLWLHGAVIFFIIFLLGHFFGFGGKLTGKERCVLEEIKTYSEEIYAFEKFSDFDIKEINKEARERILAFLKVLAKQETSPEMSQENIGVILVSRLILEKCKIKY